MMHNLATLDSVYNSVNYPFSAIFWGIRLVGGKPVPTFSSEIDPMGLVYFFIFDHEYGNETTKLVRLPGSCVKGQVPCPEPEKITLPFGLNFSLMPLVWSPNGKYAAVAYPVSQDGNTAALFLFDPEKQSWQSLAEFNFIDSPVWSRDGNWLAFRVQDGFGGDDIYVVRRDGSNLVNMTASDKLPPEGRPYILSGWINDNVILRSGNPGVGGLVYLRRVGDGFHQTALRYPLGQTGYGAFTRRLIPGLPDVTEQKSMLKLLTPDGNTFRDLATFQSRSPSIQSSGRRTGQGSLLQFHRLILADGRGQDVYLIDSDGRNLQQAYHSVSAGINTLSFSPDGEYLVMSDSDPTGQHIYVVNLSTLETHLLQAPGLPLDWWWLAPSWGT